jgi:hypothetical protein
MSDTTNVSRDEPDDVIQHGHHSRKRIRSLRKGTHSCWACKRRKEKCTFVDGEICTGCRRRGTKCVSQHFADNDPAPTTATTTPVTAARLQRIEDMLVQITSHIQNQTQTQMQTYTTAVTSSNPSPTPTTTLSEIAPPASTVESAYFSPADAMSLHSPLIQSSRLSRRRVLSDTLYDSLPCPQDIQLLRNATARRPLLSIVHITKSYTTLHRDGFQPTDGVLPEPPLVTAEPVLIARYMLQLAIFLQEMQPITYPELSRLVEPTVTLTERCANTAINLVTRQDDLLGSIESLEGVVLESVYQCNSGRLRLSWMASQRAILLAQSIGLHLVRENTSSHPRDALHCLDPSGTRAELPHLWFRIVHYSLQLSRMLGLPPGAADVINNKNKSAPVPHELALETPEGYLEEVYRQVMVSALAQMSPVSYPPDTRATQALDLELQRAANCVPSHWWLPPNLIESSLSPTELFWDMRRLVIQMLHHDLRTQLNVPYMLANRDVDGQRSEIARLACVHSSREVLSRFILLRDFNQSASSCRFLYFLALMAAITLVLAHLGGGGRRPQAQDQDVISSQVDGLLSHQAPSDRAMMEQALETMRNASHSSEDALCAQSAHVLHLLMDMEARNNLRIAEGSPYVSVQSQSQSDYQPATTATSTSVPEEVESVFIPYFGLMRIARPNTSDGARRTATISSNHGAEAEPAYSQDAVDLFDPLLLDLRDERWISQNIDMSFLDTFLEETT